MKLKSTILFFCATLCSIVVFAQQENSTTKKSPHALIQFSGVVVEGANLHPIPYASVIIKNSYRGAISDYYGYFSFVAETNDTIEFSAIGYTDAAFIIPDTLTTNKYSLIQVLRADTVQLGTTSVYPWPSKEQFKRAFLSLEIPDDGMERAQQNMSRSDMKTLMDGMAMTSSMNYKYTMQQYQSKLYYAGQYPPNNL